MLDLRTSLETLIDDSLSSFASPSIFQTDSRRPHSITWYSKKHTLLEEGSLIFEDLAQFSASSSSASGGDVKDITNLDAEMYTNMQKVLTSSTPSRGSTSFSGRPGQEQLKQQHPDDKEISRLQYNAETGVPPYLIPASHCISAAYIEPPNVATADSNSAALKKEFHHVFLAGSSLRGLGTTSPPPPPPSPPPQPHSCSLFFSESLLDSNHSLQQQQHSSPPTLPIQVPADGALRCLRFGGAQCEELIAQGHTEKGFQSWLAEDERLLLPPSTGSPPARLYTPGGVCGRMNSGPMECIPPGLFSLPAAGPTPWQIPPYLPPQSSLPELAGVGGANGFGWHRPLEPSSPR
ncbi:unnamed protein product [Schistocephalus solidus]|uniref:Uncharacterized protein n=1 Tax=Schistocephalus solidus TaxID=70667 RepID=A0A183T841_SCHSO|nr:unnamed protein product [Schistocephalus solidus]